MGKKGEIMLDIKQALSLGFFRVKIKDFIDDKFWLEWDKEEKSYFINDSKQVFLYKKGNFTSKMTASDLKSSSLVFFTYDCNGGDPFDETYYKWYEMLGYEDLEDILNQYNFDFPIDKMNIKGTINNRSKFYLMVSSDENGCQGFMELYNDNKLKLLTTENSL